MEQEAKQLLVLPKNSACTKPMHFFMKDYRQLLGFFFFTINLATNADKTVAVAGRALMLIDKEKYGIDEVKIAEYEQILSGQPSGPAFNKLREFSSLNARHLVTSVVDAFYCYLSHLIKCALQKNNNMLKSSEKVDTSDAIDFKNKSELVGWLIDRKINELSYGGIRKLSVFFNDRLGLDMFEDDEQRELFKIFSELRNIYVHNRAYINDVFLDRIESKRGFNFERSKRYHVDFDDFLILSNNCVRVAIRLDKIVGEKFKLERKRLATWKKINPAYTSQ